MGTQLARAKDEIKVLLDEQIAGQRAFNIIAFSTEMAPFSTAPVEATPEAIAQAKAWLDQLEVRRREISVHEPLPPPHGCHAPVLTPRSSCVPHQPHGHTSTLQALQRAADPAVGAVYLVTDGRPDDAEEEVLGTVKEWVRAQRKLRVNTVSFNCVAPKANRLLFDIA